MPRRQSNTIYLTLWLTAPEAIEEERLNQVIAALLEHAPLALHLSVISPANSKVDQWCLAQGIQRVIEYTSEAAAILNTAECVLFTNEPCEAALGQVTTASIPVVIDQTGDETWPEAGIGIQSNSADQVAALMLLVSTDPAIRRRTLDGQQRWLAEQHQANGQSHWSVQGVFDSSYSLAIVNRHLAMALEEQGRSVSLYTYEQGDAPAPDWSAVEQPELLEAMWRRSRTTQPPEVALRNAYPPVVRDMRGQIRVLANYAWEETTFPAEYAQDFNRVLDLITVVSTQTARMLQDAGVRVPIAVVGNGVDHLQSIEPAKPPIALPEGFRFLHVSSCFPRKGVDKLLEAYGQAFRAKDAVNLIIKTFPNPHNTVASQLEEIRAADPDYPSVILIEDDWTPSQIAGLYQHCHGLVAPSRGEGFGLPIAEAMLHEVPVIVTGWGGHMDFCNPSNAWIVDYELNPARTHLGQPDSLWAEPDLESLADRLRELYMTTAQETQAHTHRAREQMLRRYSWSSVAKRTVAAVETIRKQPAPLATPRIGWISTWGSRCGIGDYSQHLIRAFDTEQLIVFAPTDEHPESADPGFVHRNWERGNPRMERLLRDINEADLDAVVIQHHWSFMGIEPLAELVAELEDRDIAAFVEFHNTRKAPEGGAYQSEWGKIGRATRIFGHSIHDVRRLSLLSPRDNISLFPLAIYPLPEPDQSSALAAELGISNKRVIATFGFLMPHKGLKQIIEAMPDILALQPDAHLLMLNAWYSTSQSEAEYQQLQETIEKHGLSTHITLITDFLSSAEISDRLALSELVVFPYQDTDESASAAVRMALAASRPIAVTPLPIFDDLRDIAGVMPGTTPSQIAHGVLDQLSLLEDTQHRDQAIAGVQAHANRHSADTLSERLRDCITGCVRALHWVD